MTKLMEYVFTDNHDRMEALSDSNIDAYFEMLEASTQESRIIANVLMYSAWTHGCVRIERGREQWHYLHRSAKYLGDLQLTTWDEHGPVSDERIREAGDLSYLMNGTVRAYV